MSLVVLGCGGGSGSSAPVDPEPNRAPTLTQVTAERDSLDEGSNTSLSVLASDPDGDPLTYTWTQSPFAPLGAFNDETGATRTWTAPLLSRDTAFVLNVTVSDGKGGTAQGSVQVRVKNVAALNQSPSVYADISVGSSRIIPGDFVPLFIGASDPDGDPLTYVWSTEPEGVGAFTNPTRASAEWWVPESGTAASYSLRVTVSDGTSAVTRTVPVSVGLPSYSQDIQPIWDLKCTDCHNAYSAEGLDLQANASYASLVNAAGVGACRPMARVIPGKLDESLLLWRITRGDCGPRMPLGASDYFEQNPGEFVRIRSWVLSGAPNN